MAEKEKKESSVMETIKEDAEILQERKAEKKKKKKGWWGKKSIGGKIAFIFITLVLMMCLLIFLLWANCRSFLDDDLANLILGVKYNEYDDLGNITATHYYQSGWEVIGDQIMNSLFSIVMSLIVMAIAFLAFFLLKLIINLSMIKGGRKSKTIGSLLKSCVKYITILVAIGVILAIWGVNVTAIVAGVGVLTLVIGLGCQSLINDVVSGLFLIFDDFFSVGDIVIVDGFRGTVVGIGLKTTRLLDGGGNYKSITNSSINTVVNLSRKPSLFTVSMDASYNEDIERVESIIMENLPKINKANPKLTTPLTYAGISGFGDAGVTYLFVGYCNEADRFQVTRDINRDVYQMFAKNDIIIPFNQITVNPADPTDRPLATKAKAKVAQDYWKSKRALPASQDPKKRTFIEKTRDAIMKEAKEAGKEDND